MQCLHTDYTPIGSTDSSTVPERINSGVFHINVWFGIMYYVCLVVQALVGDRHCKLTNRHFKWTELVTGICNQRVAF